MSFVYIPNPSLWLVLIIFDLSAYFFIFSNFGASNIGIDDSTNYGDASLDPFGKNIIKQYLEKIIKNRLAKKRDNDLYKKVKNRSKLQKEARKKKREADNLRRKNQFENFKQSLRGKWDNLKAKFYETNKVATNDENEMKQNDVEWIDNIKVNGDDLTDSSNSNETITLQ